MRMMELIVVSTTIAATCTHRHPRAGADHS